MSPIPKPSDYNLILKSNDLYYYLIMLIIVLSSHSTAIVLSSHYTSIVLLLYYAYYCIGLRVVQIMTETTASFSTIKQQLQSLSINSEQFNEKLAYINQTRSKINNELVNLTKDYDKKLK